MEAKSKTVSPAAILALKETLAAIYWIKSDLRKFIELTIKNTAIVGTIPWETNAKYQSASELIDRMCARPDIYQYDLLSLFEQACSMNDFSHLSRWDNGEELIRNAAIKVKALRTHSEGYFQRKKEEEDSEKRRQVRLSKITESQAIIERLAQLKAKYFGLVTEEDAQKRGYALETFLNELFMMFDLDPKASFKIIGEQIDGAFTFEQTDYLLEAKWVSRKINASDLFEFGGKLSGKLKNTLGLFISINGFSSESLEVSSPVLKQMILMDGEDLMAVLDGRIELKDLMYIKRRHASQTGKIFIGIRDIL
jgi:restriction endonuclease Mrr